MGEPERSRARPTQRAFAADPELAQGLSTMLADLPPDTQVQLMRPLAGPPRNHAGALMPAIVDVIQDALERSEREGG